MLSALISEEGHRVGRVFAALVGRQANSLRPAAAGVLLGGVGAGAVQAGVALGGLKGLSIAHVAFLPRLAVFVVAAMLSAAVAARLTGPLERAAGARRTCTLLGAYLVAGLAISVVGSLLGLWLPPLLQGHGLREVLWFWWRHRPAWPIVLGQSLAIPSSWPPLGAALWLVGAVVLAIDRRAARGPAQAESPAEAAESSGRAFTVALLGLCAGMLLIGPIAHLRRTVLLLDWGLNTYLQLDRLDAAWQQAMRAYDLTVFGVTSKALYAVGVPTPVIEIAILATSAILMATGAYLAARALIRRATHAWLALPPVLFCSFARTNLGNAAGPDAAFANRLFWPLYYAPAEGGILVALGAGLAGRPWLAAAGLAVAEVFHPLHGAYTLLCVLAMLAPQLWRDRRALVPMALAFVVLVAALAPAALGIVESVATLPVSLVVRYHQAFNSHFYPSSLFLGHAPYRWFIAAPFAASLVVFPVVARPLGGPHVGRLLRGFYACAAAGVGGVILTVFAPQVLLLVQASVPRATGLSTALCVMAVAAYVVRQPAARLSGLVGVLALVWMIVMRPPADAGGLPFALLGLVLLLDAEHPWPRVARGMGVVLVVTGLPGLGPALVPHAWLHEAQVFNGAFALHPPGGGWVWAAAVAAAYIGVRWAQRGGSFSPRGAAVALAACVLLAMGLGAERTTATHAEELRRRSADERLAISEWARTTLPPGALVMAGPRMYGVRAIMGRPGLGPAREWVYFVPMVYKSGDAHFLARGKARLERFGVDVDDYTVNWPGRPTHQARVKFDRAYSRAFNSMPYAELRALARDEGADYLWIQRRSDVDPADVVFQTEHFLVIDLTRGAAKDDDTDAGTAERRHRAG